MIFEVILQMTCSDIIPDYIGGDITDDDNDNHVSDSYGNGINDDNNGDAMFMIMIIMIAMVMVIMLMIVLMIVKILRVMVMVLMMIVMMVIIMIRKWILYSPYIYHGGF